MNKHVWNLRWLVSPTDLTEIEAWCEAAIRRSAGAGAHKGVFGSSKLLEDSGWDVTLPDCVIVDAGGRVMEISTDTIDFSQDENNDPTLPPAGQSRWILAVIEYLVDETNSQTDPITGTPFFFHQLDSYRVRVIMGTAAGGTPAPPAVGDAVIVGGMIRTDTTPSATQEVLDAGDDALLHDHGIMWRGGLELIDPEYLEADLGSLAGIETAQELAEVIAAKTKQNELDLSTHEADVANPHSVTATQAGADPAGTAAAAVSAHELTYDHAELHAHANKAILDGISDSGSGAIITAAEREKIGHIAVSQPVDLDLMETQAATGSAHAGIVTGNPHGLNATDVGADPSGTMAAHEITYDHAELHAHANKTVLDGISAGDITNWSAAYTHSVLTSGNPHNLDSTDVGAAPSSHVGAGGAAHADAVAGGDDGFMTGGEKQSLDSLLAIRRHQIIAGEVMETQGNGWTSTFGELYSALAGPVSAKFPCSFLKNGQIVVQIGGMVNDSRTDAGITISLERVSFTTGAITTEVIASAYTTDAATGLFIINSSLDSHEVDTENWRYYMNYEISAGINATTMTLYSVYIKVQEP